MMPRGPTRLDTGHNGVSIGSAVFAELTVMSNIQPDTHRLGYMRRP